MTNPTLISIPVGRLACQRDSYQRTLDAIVVECKPSATQPGHFEVTLDDTVLFPEGGGQPADHGTIDGTPVVTVQRRGLSAVHVVPKQLAEGTSVKLEVDYTRRFDVMQQHTGQHLITAVIEKELGLRTVSWSLGSEISYIELDSGAKGKQAPTIDQIATAEAHIDEYIRASLPISVATITKSDISSSTGVSLDKLPDDLAGSGDLAVRVVSIGDMDRNPCCGTHMQNSAHLQSIKLLHMERVSGGNVKLHFVAGGRVLQLLGKLHDHSRTLTGLLSGGVDMQVDAVKRLQDSARAATKSTTRLSRELAPYIAQSLLAPDVLQNGIASLHREDADMDMLSAISAALLEKAAPGSLRAAVLVGGEAKDGGAALVVGQDATAVTSVGKLLTNSVPGLRGGGRGGRWQGKAPSWPNLQNVFAKIQQL